jgi:hypothetical protein
LPPHQGASLSDSATPAFPIPIRHHPKPRIRPVASRQAHSISGLKAYQAVTWGSIMASPAIRRTWQRGLIAMLVLEVEALLLSVLVPWLISQVNHSLTSYRVLGISHARNPVPLGYRSTAQACTVPSSDRPLGGCRWRRIQVSSLVIRGTRRTRHCMATMLPIAHHHLGQAQALGLIARYLRLP